MPYGVCKKVLKMQEDPSVVAQWDELMLAAVRAGGAKPTATTYQLHLATSAIYDAWAAYDTDAFGYYSDIVRPESEHSMANKEIAVSFAAYRMLVELFPGQKPSFDAFMQDLGHDPDDTSVDPSTAAGVGNLAAQNVFAARLEDGSNSENGYADTTGYVAYNSADPSAENAPGGEDFDPNVWQPLRVPTGTVLNENGVPVVDPDDPTSYVDQIALTPQWGGVDSFALLSGDQFRPPPPPQLGDFSVYVDAQGNVTTGDQAYRDQTAQVVEFSANLDNEGKVIAEYWADGPRTESPPGHWNQIAQDIALREGHGIDEDVKLFFALNAALFDAGIATWEAKFHYDYVRPQSAIRDLYYGEEIASWAGPDQGTQMIQGQEWQPYQATTFVTPPFPEFVSGHSTFSMAAANTIAAFVGSDTFYDGVTHSNYDLDRIAGLDLIGQYVTTELAFEEFEGDEPVVLQWATLTEAAEEAGLSRLYGGIHFMDGNLRGLDLGGKVATQVQIRWDAQFTRAGDDFIRAGADGGLLVAGSGDDTVKGRDGDDYVEGGTGNDKLMGSAGDDTLLGGSGNDTLYGSNNDDLLLGEDGEDQLRAGAGNDEVHAGDGDDRAWGGTGQDELYGGEGNDTLRGNGGDDTLRGEGGDDRLRGGAGNDEIHAGDGDDWAWGGTGQDDLYGGDDNDHLKGQDGDDRLWGEDGNDEIDGGAGQDELDGGWGDDTLTGGEDADVFIFWAGSDVVTDFQDGIDTLALDKIFWGCGLTVQDVLDTYASTDHSDTVFDFHNGDTLRLVGIVDPDLLLDDIIFF
jgi:Ca2+-binding RTX toxin-like protein